MTEAETVAAISTMLLQHARYLSVADNPAAAEIDYVVDQIDRGDWKPHLPKGGAQAPEPTEAEVEAACRELQDWAEGRGSRYALGPEPVREALRAAYAVRTPPATGEAEPKPCKKCGRTVKSPCDDYEGYRTAGPWDTFCADYFGDIR